MPNWLDTLIARAEGKHDGFIGKDENLDAPEVPEVLRAPEERQAQQ